MPPKHSQEPRDLLHSSKIPEIKLVPKVPKETYYMDKELSKPKRSVLEKETHTNKHQETMCNGSLLVQKPQRG